jgi:N-alpha-acetyltransferase 38, NatC auxiliary subunit
MAMSKDDSLAFLKSLINKNLRITTSDNRIFYGSFKCTDPVRAIHELQSGEDKPHQEASLLTSKQDCNVVLSQTFEYRQQTPEAAAAAAAAGGSAAPFDIDKTARYLGLVVVPGEQITAIAAEGKDLPADMDWSRLGSGPSLSA